MDEFQRFTDEEKKETEEVEKDSKCYLCKEVPGQDELPLLELKLKSQELNYYIVDKYLP